MMLLSWLKRVDIALNQLLGGQPGQTISARLGCWIEGQADPPRLWVAMIVCGLIAVIDMSHCERALKNYRRWRDRRNQQRNL